MKKKLIVVVAPLLLLAGCARYKANKLKPLEVERVAGYEHEELFVGVKALSKKESKEYLGKDAITKGYQPIQIAIENNTQRYIQFSYLNCNCKTLSPEMFAKKMYDKTWVRIAGWGFAGLFGFGTLGSIALWTAISLAPVTPIASALLLVPYVAFVPTIVDPIWSAEANEQMLSDYLKKAMPNTIIKPHARIEGLLFTTKEAFRNDFMLVLIDTNSQEKIVYKKDLSVKKR